MSLLRFENICISAMNACVPKRFVDNMNFSDFFSEEEANKVVQMTGIRYRRWADPSVVASDVAYYAAKQLLVETNLRPDDIDAILFCTVTADYRMPATAFVLHDRLNFPISTLCFDINVGCSGFVYSLAMASALLDGQGLDRILVINAHTAINYTPRRDKATSLLFGDGATATIVAKGKAHDGTDLKSCFSLNSDGSGYQAIIKEAGGYRIPTSPETLVEKVREDGSLRNDEHAKMDGPMVFDFTITQVPRDIKHIMEFAGKTVEDIDIFLFHQANLFIIKHISKKLKIPMEKIPLTLEKYGNLSSASLPLTMISELRGHLNDGKKEILMTAFGVGLSWASAIMTVDSPYIGPIVEI